MQVRMADTAVKDVDLYIALGRFPARNAGGGEE
jgi:hypothetical protein